MRLTAIKQAALSHIAVVLHYLHEKLVTTHKKAACGRLYGLARCFVVVVLAVVHHAEIAPEVSGVHDDVGFGRLREGFPDARPAQMAVDGFTATTVLRGKLCRCLLACAVGCPKFIALATPATVKLPAAIAAFIALLAVAPPILFDLLRATEKAFFVFKGFDPA